MTKTNWLGIIIGVLLVSNGMLAYKIMSSTNKRGHRQHKKHETPKDVIIGTLDFDYAQQKQYETAISIHRNQIDRKDQEIRAKKEQLYSLLSESNDTLKSQIMTDLSSLKSDIEMIHFNHFIEIKSICRANQLDRYNALTQQLGGLFRPKGPKRKR